MVDVDDEPTQLDIIHHNVEVPEAAAEVVAAVAMEAVEDGVAAVAAEIVIVEDGVEAAEVVDMEVAVAVEATDMEVEAVEDAAVEAVIEDDINLSCSFFFTFFLLYLISYNSNNSALFSLSLSFLLQKKPFLFPSFCSFFAKKWFCSAIFFTYSFNFLQIHLQTAQKSQMNTNFPHNRKRTLYVGGFTEDVTEKVLMAAFIPFGDVVAISIPMDYESGKHRGFGFVEFDMAEDAAMAIDNMNESELFGKTIRLGIGSGNQENSPK